LKHTVIFTNLRDLEAALKAIKKIAGKYATNISFQENDAIKVKLDFFDGIRDAFETVGKRVDDRSIKKEKKYYELIDVYISYLLFALILLSIVVTFHAFVIMKLGIIKY
jgi:hypothetical protein